MTYRLVPGFLIIAALLESCASQKQGSRSAARSVQYQRPAVVNKNPKFLDNISVTPESSAKQKTVPVRKKNATENQLPEYSPGSIIENAGALQIKYAVLLNTEVEEVRNPWIYQFIDDWYGTKYCLGGTTKNCIDCSAFVQTFFSKLYGIRIPRTAKEQYDASRKISVSRLEQGDLLFFNTRGGISHVGVYLQNNKFVHASTTGGVMISDLDETYYTRHFVSAGRIDNRIEATGRR